MSRCDAALAQALSSTLNRATNVLAYLKCDLLSDNARMSVEGQSRPSAPDNGKSGPPPATDMSQHRANRREGPEAEFMERQDLFEHFVGPRYDRCRNLVDQ